MVKSLSKTLILVLIYCNCWFLQQCGGSVTERPTTTVQPATKEPTTTSQPVAKEPTTTAKPVAKVPTTTAQPVTKVPTTTAQPVAKETPTTINPTTIAPTTTIQEPSKKIIWCALEDKEKEKCDEWVSKNGNDLTCVTGKSHQDCYEKIAKGEADLASFDGGDIYHAGKLFGLKVIMSEKSSGGPSNTSSYYAVAVVKNGTSWTLSTLKGAKSCHTGIGKTSGWNVPVGYLLEKNIMEWKHCNVFKSVASFFSASCAPGANNINYNQNKTEGDKLCSLCIGGGIGADKCARSSKETYYGYKGAFKCLEDDRGDVAFIKQSILTSLSTSEKAKYKLLCKDNTQKGPDMYASCNLALVPGHAVLTSKSKTASEVLHYQEFLEKADASYGIKGNDSFKLYTNDNLLFSGSTEKLVRIPIDQQGYDSYLSRSYIDTIKGLKGCKHATGKGTSLTTSIYLLGIVVAASLFIVKH